MRVLPNILRVTVAQWAINESLRAVLVLVQLRPRDIRTNLRLTCTKHLHRSFLTSLCFGDPIVSLPSAGRIKKNSCSPLVWLYFNPFLFSLPLMNWYLVLDKYTSFFLSSFLTSLSFLPIFLLHENLTWGCHVCSVGPESKIYLCVSNLYVWTVSSLIGYSGMHEGATDTEKVRRARLQPVKLHCNIVTFFLICTWQDVVEHGYVLTSQDVYMCVWVQPVIPVRSLAADITTYWNEVILITEFR